MNARPPWNILRVITWLPVGGIERKIVALLPRLDPGRFRPRLVCLRERGPLADTLEQAGVPVDLCPFASRLSPGGIFRLAVLMRRHQIHLVHAHMYRAAVPATIAARLAGVPVVWSQVHNVNTWETPRQLAMDRFLSRWRHGTIAVSQRVHADVMQQLRLPAQRVPVIYNGVDLDHFHPDPAARPALRHELGLPPTQRLVIYHGRLVEQKNPEALLQAARQVLRPRPDTTLLVAGDGPRRAPLESQAREEGLLDANAIRFLGRRDDIPRLLQASDLALLPSLKEGFSNAVVEALASGLPILATDAGGNAEAIEPGQSGQIVPPGDLPALLTALATLLDQPEPRHQAMRQAARHRAQRFSLDRMIQDVETLYTHSLQTRTT